MRYGIDPKLFDWSNEITADGPWKQARNLTQVLNLRRLQTEKAAQIQDFLTGRPSCGAKFSGPQISLFA
jgi:hypothetical protein